MAPPHGTVNILHLYTGFKMVAGSPVEGCQICVVDPTSHVALSAIKWLLHKDTKTGHYSLTLNGYPLVIAPGGDAALGTDGGNHTWFKVTTDPSGTYNFQLVHTSYSLAVSGLENGATITTSITNSSDEYQKFSINPA